MSKYLANFGRSGQREVRKGEVTCLKFQRQQEVKAVWADGNINDSTPASSKIVTSCYLLK